MRHVPRARSSSRVQTRHLGIRLAFILFAPRRDSVPPSIRRRLGWKRCCLFAGRAGGWVRWRPSWARASRPSSSSTSSPPTSPMIPSLPKSKLDTICCRNLLFSLSWGQKGALEIGCRKSRPLHGIPLPTKWRPVGPKRSPAHALTHYTAKDGRGKSGCPKEAASGGGGWGIWKGFRSVRLRSTLASEENKMPPLPSPSAPVPRPIKLHQGSQSSRPSHFHGERRPLPPSPSPPLIPSQSLDLSHAPRPFLHLPSAIFITHVTCQRRYVCLLDGSSHRIKSDH